MRIRNVHIQRCDHGSLLKSTTRLISLWLFETRSIRARQMIGGQ